MGQLPCRGTSCFKTKLSMRSRIPFVMFCGLFPAAGVVWGQSMMHPLPSPDLPSVDLAQAPSLRAVTVGLKVDASLPGMRILHLPKRVAVQGAQGCGDAHTIRLGPSNAVDRPAEAALIELALRTGKPLRITGARCVSDGVMSGSSAALEPDPDTVDLCEVALMPNRPTTCKK